MAIYALKVDEGWRWLIPYSLMQGEGRFGWSYVDTADLRDLRDRIAADGWNSLHTDEKDCYEEVLLSLKCGDHVIYINVPEWGQCTLAKVTGKYFWRWADNDFNHRFPVDPNSIQSFDRNDATVAPALSARLKLRGRCHRIDVEEEFRRLTEALGHGVEPAPRTLGVDPHDLRDEKKPFLSTAIEKIRNMHPDTDLEILVEQLFRRVPGVRSVARQGGAGDRGADLIVELESGSIPELVQTLVVKVTSHQGTVSDPSSVVNDLRRAFGAYGADMVLIVSPAMNRNPAVDRELDRLREDTMKPVGLLIGEELAVFFLRHGSDLLFE